MCEYNSTLTQKPARREERLEDVVDVGESARVTTKRLELRAHNLSKSRTAVDKLNLKGSAAV